jgi:anti-sigma factor RsiW
MTCAELESLLCDYVDGTLDASGRKAVEFHLSACAACAEFARDAAAGAGFLRRAERVDPPPQLVTRILFQIPARRQDGRESWLRSIRRWFEPVMQPRFAMGMAMTILSFAMLGRFSGIKVRQLTAQDLNPAAIWTEIDDRAHRTWARAVKYYESLRFVYEIQSRLKEWTEQDHQDIEDRKAGAEQPPRPDSAGSGASSTSRGAEGRQE